MTDANPGDEITSALFNTKFDRNGGQTFTGNFIPDGDGTRDLGSSGAKWKDLYLSGASIHFGTDILGIGSGSLQYKGNTIMNSSGKLDATALLGNLPALNGGSLTSLTKTQVGLSAVPNTDFTTPVGTNTTHRGLSNNPHTVSKTQVGLSAVPNTDFTSPVGLNTTHRGSSSNPHTVTKSQVSLGNVPNTDFTTSVGLNTTHRGLTNNPHSVDKADVGLSNVPNTDFTTSVGLNTTHRGLTNNPHSVDKTDVSLGNVPNTDATNASNIGTGTLADARLTSNVTLEGNTFNGASQLVQMTSATKLPAVDGSLLTNLPGGSIADGEVTVPKLSCNNCTAIEVYNTEDTTWEFPGSVSMTWEVVRIAGKYTGFSGTITKLGFMLRKNGSPTGNISFVVRAVSGDTILGTKVMGSATILTAATYYYYEVVFDTPIVISSPTDIYLSVEHPNTSEGSDYIQVGEDDGTNTADAYTYDTSWNAFAGNWIGFKVTTEGGEAWTFTDVTPSTMDRGIFGGGVGGSYITMDYITISALSNATDFGDLTTGRYGMGACASSTRGLWGGGYIGGGGATNIIEYTTIATLGNSTDFGDLTRTAPYCGSCSNETRGVWAGGNTNQNVIDYVTIATTGNAQDFGDLTSGRSWWVAGCSNTTRGLIGGGDISGTDTNSINYITFASTGNAINFGNLTLARDNVSSSSNTTRGCWYGGNFYNFNNIDYVTIASTGNASDFGDLATGLQYSGATANKIRGVIGGGQEGSSSVNRIQYMNFATTGNTTDFGDLTAVRDILSGLSDSHGGLA